MWEKKCCYVFLFSLFCGEKKEKKLLSVKIHINITPHIHIPAFQIVVPYFALFILTFPDLLTKYACQISFNKC